ncbi:uncharacterized protein [Cicer arietinum]|uniref:uncharacterized protein n=1 Tax=Cicer arietinum TaxID=3827 RepID=UPI00032A9C70
MDSSSSATPLWRQGPAEKPVLCNACGSRYRHWGTLDNYLPKHSIGKDLVVPHPIICTNNLLFNFLGESSSSLWASTIPSKKRTRRGVYKRLTPMERFQKQLLDELKLQGIPNEPSPEEVLLFQNVNSFIPSNEIGLGGILLERDGTSI